MTDPSYHTCPYRCFGNSSLCLHTYLTSVFSLSHRPSFSSLYYVRFYKIKKGEAESQELMLRDHRGEEGIWTNSIKIQLRSLYGNLLLQMLPLLIKKKNH